MEPINSIEMAELDLRYESYRIKHPKQEERLLLSMVKQGILNPL